jgi:hypothetical protein
MFFLTSGYKLIAVSAKWFSCSRVSVTIHLHSKMLILFKKKKTFQEFEQKNQNERYHVMHRTAKFRPMLVAQGSNLQLCHQIAVKLLRQQIKSLYHEIYALYNLQWVIFEVTHIFLSIKVIDFDCKQYNSRELIHL